MPGTYDDTCFSGAFSAAGSAQNVTFMMGPNTYTLQNGLSISSKTGWTIMGLKARSKLTVKNGLNTAMLTLNSTTDFAMRDVFADGNYTNQTSETSVISATGIVGLILEGKQVREREGPGGGGEQLSLMTSHDGLFIVDNIISGTTDSALYLALRYDGLTITGNRIDGVGVDGSNPQKAAAIYVTHGGTFGGLLDGGLQRELHHGLAQRQRQHVPAVWHSVRRDRRACPSTDHVELVYERPDQLRQPSITAVTCVTAMPSVVNGNATQILPRRLLLRGRRDSHPESAVHGVERGDAVHLGRRHADGGGSAGPRKRRRIRFDAV